MDLDENCLVLAIGGVIVLYALVAISFYVLPLVYWVVYWVVATISFWFMAALSWLFAESLTPQRPEIMWAVWGGLLGGILGFLPSAPLYGLRRYRGTFVWAAVALMLLVAICRTSAYSFI